MEISKALIISTVRHVKCLLERGSFDTRDIKSANALRLVKKEIKKLERKIEYDENRNIKPS